MIKNIEKKDKAPKFFVLVIIALQMHLSLLVFAGLVFFLASQELTYGSRSEGLQWNWGWSVVEGNEVLLYVVMGVALFSAILALAVPWWSKSKEMPTQESLSFSMEPMVGKSQGFLFSFREMNQRIFSLTILRLALCESIAVLGFIFCFINRSTHWIIPFVAVALIWQFLLGPLFGKIFNAAEGPHHCNPLK